MDIRRAAALLLALVMIAALTVGCGKKQSDTPTDTPAAGADGRTPAQQPAKLVCYNGSVTLRFVREEDTWYWGDDRDFPLEQSIVTELLATVQGYAALSPLPHTDDLSQFGLSDTKRYISLTDTEGNTRTYWLGTQTDEGQYIQPEDETDAVYLSPAGVDGTLSMGIYDMARLPKLPQLTADNVSALTVTAADGKSLSLTASEGDFISWDAANLESTAQVIIALCSLGVDPATDARFVKNGISTVDGLMRYRLDDGTFRHILTDGSDVMATEQALLAQEAMERLSAARRSLYDFREEMPEDVKTQVTALNEALTDVAVATPEEVQALYTRYLAIPAAERSYVFAAGALLDRMQELFLEITPEDPAQAYELRVAAEVTTSGPGAVVWIAAGAAVVVVAAGMVIWSKRRKICTK